MATVKGYLNQIKERPTKFGTYYTLVVDGKDYDTGSKFPVKGAAPNDYVTFEMKKKDNGYETLVQGSLSKIDAPAGSSPAAASAAVAAAGGMDRQEIISRQAALNTALQMTTLLQAAGAIPEGKAASAAAKADKLEAIVMSYTTKFYRYSTGNDYEIPEEDVVAAATAVDWAQAE